MSVPPIFRDLRCTGWIGSGAATVQRPPGHNTGLLEDGTLLIAVLESDSGFATAPAGWNVLNQTSWATTQRIQIWWRIANGEPFTWTWTAAAAGPPATICVYAITGHDPNNPIYDWSVGPFVSPGTLLGVTPPSPSIDNVGCLYGAVTDASHPVTFPADATKAISNMVGASGYNIGAGWDVLAAGPQATRNLTFASSYAAGWCVLINPDPTSQSGPLTLKRLPLTNRLSRPQLDEPGAWTEIPDANGITSYDGGTGYYKPAYYRDIFGWVHFRGMVKGPTNTVWTTLSSTIQPAKGFSFPTIGNFAGGADGPQALELGSSGANPGELRLRTPGGSAGSHNWLSLSGLSFRALNAAGREALLRDETLDAVLRLALALDQSPALGWASPFGGLNSQYEGGSDPLFHLDPQGFAYLRASKPAALSTAWGAGATLFQIPAGYRPDRDQTFFITQYDGSKYKSVQVNNEAASGVPELQIFTGGSTSDGGVYYFNRVQWRANDFAPGANLRDAAAASALKGRVDPDVLGVQAPSLQNSWALPSNPVYAPPGYYRDAFGRCHLRGAVRGGLNGNAAFTLPDNCRPIRAQGGNSPMAELFAVDCNGSMGRVDVMTDGRVIPMAPSNTTFVSLGGISFRCVP